MEKLDEKPVMKISCHTGTYGTLPDDVHILFQTCECIVSGPSLFQTLRIAKSQLARGKYDFNTMDKIFQDALQILENLHTVYFSLNILPKIKLFSFYFL